MDLYFVIIGILFFIFGLLQIILGYDQQCKEDCTRQ